jgi:Na+-transporting methylmalonyl-CoA/oxaloacetate decarboxylase gamma subunit
VLGAEVLLSVAVDSLVVVSLLVAAVRTVSVAVEVFDSVEAEVETEVEAPDEQAMEAGRSVTPPLAQTVLAMPRVSAD